MTSEPEREAGRSRISHRILAAAGALHLGLLWYFTPSRVVLSGQPFHTFDYALHAYQVDRALRAFRAAGRLWSYDPFVLAGQPAGALEDVTNRSIELFVIAGARLGISPWAAFDAFVLLVHLALPFVAWKSARLFDLSKLSASIAVLSWVLLWYFDSLLHWFWYVGMISWSLASYLSILVLSFAYRATERHERSAYAALAATSALLTLVHPFAALTLAVPLAALYVRSFRILARWEHAAIGGAAAAATLTAPVWLAPALRFRHLVTGDIDTFLRPTASYVAFDWLDLMKDVLMTGQPVRTAFRSLAFGLALFGAIQLRRAGDRRVAPLALLAFGGLALGYGSGYFALLRQTQPYRHVGPATLAAALLGAAVLPDLLGAARDGWDRSGRAAVVLALALGIPVLARTVVGFMPSLLPGGPPLRRTADDPAAETPEAGRELAPTVQGYDGPLPVYPEIARYLEQTIGQTGRVAVFDWVLGEYLATFSTVPILGGIPQRFIPQAAAHPLRLKLTPEREGDDPIARYLERYAVQAVVTHGARGPFDARPDLLLPVEGFGRYRVYRTTRAPSYFEVGRGRVSSQALDSVRISDASGEEVVLRFHYLKTLRCRPNCTVERATERNDDAGFIRVRRPPAEFEILNVGD